MVLSLDEQSTSSHKTLNYCCCSPSWMLVHCHWWLHLEANCSSQLLFWAENCIYKCQMMCWVGWILFHDDCGCDWFGYEHMWVFLWQCPLEWLCTDSDSDSEIIYSATYHTITIFTYIWFQYNGSRRPPLKTKSCRWHGGHQMRYLYVHVYIIFYIYMYI